MLNYCSTGLSLFGRKLRGGYVKSSWDSDSGIGGYTVLKALQARFPHENWLYLQDAQHRPYGSKSQNEIVHLGKKCLDTLVAAGVKACVVACHTSSHWRWLNWNQVTMLL